MSETSQIQDWTESLDMPFDDVAGYQLLISRRLLLAFVFLPSP